jgi:predicted transposase YbfD/YdcC
VPEKSNEITSIPVLLDHLAAAGQLEGALVTIDAMGCQVEIAAKIVEHEADFLLPLKGNQPTLEAEVGAYFETAPADELVSKTTIAKGHGRIETRLYTASKVIDWLKSDRTYQCQPRFEDIHTIVRVLNRTEYAGPMHFRHLGSTSPARRSISNGSPPARAAIGASRACTGCSTSSSRTTCRATASGHGAKNTAVVRRFSLGLIRANKSKESVKTRRKRRAGVQISSSKSCK